MYVKEDEGEGLNEFGGVYVTDVRSMRRFDLQGR